MPKKQPFSDSPDSLVSSSNRLGTLTPANLEKLAERSDFGKVLDALGVPRPPWPVWSPQKWSKGIEFDVATFDQAAYKQYTWDFFRK